MKHFLCKRIIKVALIACCLSIPIHFAYGQNFLFSGQTRISKDEDAKVKDPNKYFKDANVTVQALAQKIARQKPITLDEVRALPEGALNARYSKEITLLFFALLQRNLQAIDVLLKAGADPYAVDYPSQDSKHDFTHYMSLVALPSSYEDTKKFRTELVRIYLANGGDPNHQLPYKAKTPLLVNTVLMDDYQGGRLLIDAGADPLVADNTGLSVPTMLTGPIEEKEATDLLTYIICRNYYNNATMEQVERIIRFLIPTGPKNPARDALFKKMAMYILKRHPDYQDSKASKMIFGGPIPWKEILDSDDTELCHVK